MQPPLSGRSPQKTLRALAQRPPYHRLLLKRKQIKRRSPPRSPARCPRPCTHTGGDAKPARSRSKAARTAPRGRAPSSPRPEVRNPGAKPRSDPRCPHQPATPRGTTPGANPAACTRSPPLPPVPLTLHAQPAGAEHTCYQSGHIPNHSTTGPRCAASSARRAARPGRGGAGRAGAGFPGPPRGWPGRRSGSRPTAGRRRCAHPAAAAAVALHLPPPLGAARSLACAL